MEPINLNAILTQLSEKNYSVLGKPIIRKDRPGIELVIENIAENKSLEAAGFVYNVINGITSQIGSIEPKYNAEKQELRLFYTLEKKTEMKTTEVESKEAKKTAGCGRTYGPPSCLKN